MNSKNQSANRLILLFPYLLFFLFSLIYLNWFTGYIFFYQEKSSLFLVSWQFLAQHLLQPGGFLNYLGELQTTFYYYPLIGAVLVSLEIVFIIYLVQRIGKTISGNLPLFIPFAIGGLLFYLQTNYRYSSFNNLGILSLLFVLMQILKVSKQKAEWIFVVVFPVFYFLFGSFSILLLSLFSVVLILNKSFYKTGVLWLLALVFFFAGKQFLFFQTTKSLIVFPYTDLQIGSQTKLFFAVIFLLLLLPLLFRIQVKWISSLAFKKIKLVEISPFLLLAVLVIVAVQRIDKKDSHYFHVEKLFYQQKYNEIIEFNRKFPSTNILTGYFNNIALSETGKLNDELFRFPQSADGSSLFLKWEIITEVLKRGGYFYYHLGMVNEAQRWAYEFMVMRGNTPEGIKMLIKTELINGKYKSASKFISILKKSVFYRKQARDFEKLLFDENAINKHPELGKIKELKPKNDFFVIAENPAANINLILAGDSTNRVAMEYKLAGLLLQKDMKGIVNELAFMEKMGYNRIPKNVEEAIVTYKLLKIGEMPELQKLKINPQTVQRFNQYYQLFQQNQSNKLQAQRALAPNFGDTYWYYVFFN